MSQNRLMTHSEFLGITTDRDLTFFRQRLVIRNERFANARNEKEKSWLRKSKHETKVIIKKLENEK